MEYVNIQNGIISILLIVLGFILKFIISKLWDYLNDIKSILEEIKKLLSKHDVAIARLEEKHSACSMEVNRRLSVHDDNIKDLYEKTEDLHEKLK